MWGIAGVGDVQQSSWQQQQQQQQRRRQCVHAAVINESPGQCSINTRCVRIHYAECVGTPSTAVHATPSSNGLCEDTLQKQNTAAKGSDRPPHLPPPPVNTASWEGGGAGLVSRIIKKRRSGRGQPGPGGVVAPDVHWVSLPGREGGRLLVSGWESPSDCMWP